MNGTPSSWSDVLSGIPQGSVLGTLIFVIFINYICELLTSSASIFAADTKLYKIIKDTTDTIPLQFNKENANKE